MNSAPSVLTKILEDKRRAVEKAKAQLSEEEFDHLIDSAWESAASGEGFRLATALRRKDRVNVIAEFKRASPSRGMIDGDADPSVRVREYEEDGASAVSVLTEELHFQGSAEDLQRVRAATSLPLLRKDFIMDPFQIYESKLFGADAVLLIVSALSQEQLEGFIEVADSLRIDALVEVHDKDEMARAVAAGARLIGVNNRNLKTFDVSLDVSRELILLKPEEALMVSESGITSRENIDELIQLGYDGFLIGEAAMKHGLGIFEGAERISDRAQQGN